MKEERKAATGGPAPSWPILPLTVRWPDAEPEVLEDWFEVETGLEFFDSEIPSAPVEVVDALGRQVWLVVEGCDVKVFALKTGLQTTLS